ncbi:hypothetical protein CAOG_08510 [Capsaspora owczarzaki ATCC 30864]|uniref:hypothetical protein n=1 Tax=Capsaspora owczarzaki (strain ATCC 30864) TaxID=595528 RepID=UPI0003525532|nr:hypothetical protein CAOG_08510 [Capsaspora owczarzaki ATCC 30864]|eukprot:XP_011270092.1 hypothetical protein CAOG_08510 [Capsaspora owczarzaki ATCC 30864]
MATELKRLGKFQLALRPHLVYTTTTQIEQACSIVGSADAVCCVQEAGGFLKVLRKAAEKLPEDIQYDRTSFCNFMTQATNERCQKSAVHGAHVWIHGEAYVTPSCASHNKRGCQCNGLMRGALLATVSCPGRCGVCPTC